MEVGAVGDRGPPAPHHAGMLLGLVKERGHAVVQHRKMEEENVRETMVMWKDVLHMVSSTHHMVADGKMYLKDHFPEGCGNINKKKVRY